MKIEYINNSTLKNILKGEEKLMRKEDKTIILTRAIFCAISFLCCLLFIFIYIINFFQVKLNLCTKKEDKEPNDLLENEIASEDGKKSNINNKDKKKIGLGSNFMLFLTISNLFGSLFEFLFYFYYANILNEYIGKTYEEIYYKINNDRTCQLYGFAHNIFDLLAVCWTTMLTVLFYKSTNLSSNMLYDDNKYIIIGFIFSIVSCLIFCLIPFFTNSYGFARFYCSFRYKEINPEKDYQPEEEKLINKIWRYSFIIVTILSNLHNVFCLIKTNSFYSKKLPIIKKQNKKQYKLILIYVWVFRIFVIVLIVSRVFKGLSRIIVEYLAYGDTFEDIVEYINGFLFASNGIFDSIAAIFFFRGVFWCCGQEPISQEISDSKNPSDMEYIEKDNIDE